MRPEIKFHTAYATMQRTRCLKKNKSFFACKALQYFETFAHAVIVAPLREKNIPS